MTWFAFKNDGDVYDLNGAAEKELAGTLAHGYATMQEALAQPNTPATPAQASLLASFVTAASSPAGGGIVGVIQIVTVDAQGKQTGTIGPANNPVSNNVPGVGATLSGVAAIGNFFNQLLHLFSGNNAKYLLYRGLKIIIGGTVMIIGLAHITDVDHPIANAARRVPLPI